jgi:hypothetical protein
MDSEKVKIWKALVERYLNIVSLTGFVAGITISTTAAMLATGSSSFAIVGVSMLAGFGALKVAFATFSRI